MKKTLILSILLLLITSPVWGFTTAIQAVVSACGAACGVLDSQGGGAGNAIVGLDTTVDRYYAITSFTATSSDTIKTLYLDLMRSSTPTATLTISLCTGKNTGCTNADNTQAAGSLGTGYASIKFTFATGFAVTATTTYYIQVYSSAIDATKYTQINYNASVAGQVYEYSPDGTNWTSGDASGQFKFTATSCAE
jgi:hypothetical protein